MRALSAAASVGDKAMVEYLLEECGCKWQDGGLDLDDDAPQSSVFYILSSPSLDATRRFEMLKHAVSLGAPLSALSLAAAARVVSTHTFKIMSWMLEQGCPADARVCMAVARQVSWELSRRDAVDWGIAHAGGPKDALNGSKLSVPLWQLQWEEVRTATPMALVMAPAAPWRWSRRSQGWAHAR